MIESCESRVANVLARIDNLPAEEVDYKLELLQKAIMIQDEEIEELKRLANLQEKGKP